METITAYKVDETTIHLKCDSGVAMELYEHFSFYVPGYQFMPSYKNRMWDGKIRQYDRYRNTLPFGLLGKLNQFCKRRCYDLVVDRSITSGIKADSPESVKEFATQLDIRSSGQPIEARDYQLDAITTAISSNRAILLSPTGSGKSLIIYMMLRWFLQASDGKALIIVPTTSLVEQMNNDFMDYSSHDPSFNQSDVHRIYSGKEKSSESRVTISTWQSIYKMPKKFFAEYEMVVGDEVHLFKAKSLTTIMNNLSNAWFRVGTTGTLDGTQVHEHVLEGCFGPVYKVTTTKELIDADVLSKLSIDVLTLAYPDDERKSFGKRKYQDEINYIINQPRRNKFIKDLALSQQGNSLVLFNFVEAHGEPLFEMIRAEAGDRKVFFVSGKVHVDDRERIRQLTEKESNAIIVASAQTFSTGINVKNLHNIIFAAPTKSQIRVLQSIGRTLRKAQNGQPAKVWDLVDDLRWKSRKNYTFGHGIERVKIYAKEKFEYKTHSIKI